MFVIIKYRYICRGGVILYKINIDEIDLEEFKMPIILNSDNQYYFELKNKLNTYKKYIKNLNVFSEDVINNLEKNIQLIIKSIKYYYNADISKAKLRIKKLLETYIANEFIVSELDKNYAFRGISIFQDSFNKY